LMGWGVRLKLVQLRSGFFGTENTRRLYLGERGRSATDRKVELQDIRGQS